MDSTAASAMASALSKASAAPPDVRLAYGTAGFRGEASLLPAATARCGALAALRSREKRGAATGIMVTASHNPVQDNGVKLADPSGAMMAAAWEPLAAQLANARGDAALAEALQAVPWEGAATAAPRVFVGRDTRPSSEGLTAGAVRGAIAAGCAEPTDVGVVTTPQLHWVVREHNAGREATEEAYYAALAGAFSRSLGGRGDGGAGGVAAQALLVDAANGVGAQALVRLAERLGRALTLEVRNAGSGVLNLRCGADLVQKERVWPENFSAADAGRVVASVDGDADRLVFLYAASPSDAPALLDGDKIAALSARHLGGLLRAALGDQPSATVGVVQTAYANGASTRYIKDNLGVTVAVAKTGVKHLHPAAEEFDVGIYFEANGHGTVLFSDKVLGQLAEAAKGEGDAAAAAGRMLAFADMINQAVGDALSGILMVEAMLRLEGMRMSDWVAFYTDLPSRQLKVTVRDKGEIKTERAETLCVAPAALQPKIDAAVAKYASGRSFVRPSGTEDIVRVYAEAATQADADALADEVAAAVRETCA